MGLNKNLDVLEIATRFKNSVYPSCETQGECINASVELANLLVDAEFNASPVSGTFNGEGHTWISVFIDDEEWYLDITADQFGSYPSIILCLLKDLDAEIVFD